MSAKTEGTGIHTPKQVSKELQAVIGVKTISRPQLAKKVWEYIKKHNLQDPEKKRIIRPDALLGKVLGTKPIDMLKMTSALSKHLS